MEFKLQLVPVLKRAYFAHPSLLMDIADVG
jgi:hypothetical protein